MIRSVAGACALSAFLAFTVFAPAMAGGGAESTPVLKTELEGMEGMEANILRFEVEPGLETERHLHPGHVFLYVTEGSIVIDIEGMEPQTVSAGEAIYEVPDKPMVGRNASATEGAKFILFQIGPADEPLTVPTSE